MRLIAEQSIIVNRVDALWMNLSDEDLTIASEILNLKREVKRLDRACGRLAREY